jgi:DNA transformation protein
MSPSLRSREPELVSLTIPPATIPPFGGVGLYCQGLFFALIDDDTLYLKVDDATRADFERLGSQPFRPYGDDSHTMQYYELPAAVLEDREAVRPWVDLALGAARRKVAGKRKRPRD